MLRGTGPLVYSPIVEKAWLQPYAEQGTRQTFRHMCHVPP